MNKKNTLYLIDAHSYVYRAFHAIRSLSTSYGLPTQAIFGVINMILKILREKKPEYLALVFDSRGPTFRHKIFDAYKANRPGMPEDLSVQLPYIKEIIRELNLPTVELEGYEADDVIATLAKNLASECLQVVVVTGDKDLVQILSPHVVIWDPMKEAELNLKVLFERHGLSPEQMSDVMSLAGDSIDNIPGVPGIGLKTAVQLLQKYQSLENLFSFLHEITKPKLRENLGLYKDQVFLSRQLIRLKEDVPLEAGLDKFKIKTPHTEQLKELFKKLEFGKFLKDFDRLFGKGEKKEPENPGRFSACKVIENEAEVEEMLTRIHSEKNIGIMTLGSSRYPVQADFQGLIMAPAEAADEPDSTESYYMQVQNDFSKPPFSKLRAFLSDSSPSKVGYDLKYDLILLKKNGCELGKPYLDLMIAGYLLNPTSRLNLKTMAENYLGLSEDSSKTLECMHSGKDIVSCSPIAVMCKMAPIVLEKLEEKGLSELYFGLEMDLIEVLADMELTGTKIDVPFLQKMSESLEIELAEIKLEIDRLAGCEFNLNSHKQLSTVLFEKLNLPRLRKTKKTRNFSTDASILTELSLYHPLPAQILAYRNLAKLKATYVDPLPKLINPFTGRLHSSYNQAVTATGRLSCSEPNIQNIPIRSEEGRRIRQAFITEPAWALASFDYSQIELRVLAHFSKDEILKKAFESGEDVHTITAADVFNTFPEMVTPEMRRIAKTINFGVVYGMSAFGLSRELRISRKEAQDFIDAYFLKFRKVKEYMEKAVESTRATGCARTLLNRYRPIPDINQKNITMRQFAERTAINTPVQGTAADIIKLAMIRVHKSLENRQMKARMVMQVHDELILEIPLQEMEASIQLVKYEMENAVPLSVPLTVNIHSGPNWAALE